MAQTKQQRRAIIEGSRPRREATSRKQAIENALDGLSGLPLDQRAEIAFNAAKEFDDGQTVKRATERARDVLGLDHVALEVGGWPAFVDGKLTLVYVESGGSFQFVVAEKCATCDHWQNEGSFDNLAGLGEILDDGLPEWACPNCSSEESAEGTPFAPPSLGDLVVETIARAVAQKLAPAVEPTRTPGGVVLPS